jgi:hypothetical protein
MNAEKAFHTTRASTQLRRRQKSQKMLTTAPTVNLPVLFPPLAGENN